MATLRTFLRERGKRRSQWQPSYRSYAAREAERARRESADYGRERGAAGRKRGKFSRGRLSRRLVSHVRQIVGRLEQQVRAKARSRSRRRLTHTQCFLSGTAASAAGCRSA